jgi:flagellar hook protein FlgE
MMRSLFSGVSGLKVHQTRMDVIGNNIANVNTVGFKSSNVNFSDVFYQTTQYATGPNETTGAAGQNAMQIGLGSNVASITKSITTTGGSQRTDNPFDVMINGDAFFIVNSGGTNYFTKSGAFNVDAAGTLCTSTGATVMGYQVDNDGNIVKAQVSALKVMSAENLYAEPELTTAAYLSGNIDMMDEQLLSDSGFPAQVSFYDNLGNSYTMKLKVTAESAADAKAGKYKVAVSDIVDSSDNSIFAKGGVVGGTSGGGTIKLGDVEFKFDENGKLESTDTVDLQFSASNGSFTYVGKIDQDSVLLTFDAAGTDGVVDVFKQQVKDADGNLITDTTYEGLDLDFSSLTMYATSGTSKIESTKGSLEGKGAGLPVGNMTGISIDTSGKIYGSYDNGTKKLLGQIAVATFANPSGLESIGDSMFAETMNSGEFDGVGQDPTQGGGSLSTGVLEMSNVDLSSEFTNMIITQRGFQANSRIITVSDTMLEELINLKR